MAPWFGPKTIGYGIGPKTWQGWRVCAVAVAIAVGTSRIAAHMPGFPRWLVIAICVLDLAALLVIIAAKTEGD